jgi:DNA-binding response OmpR family regulator
VGDGDHGGRHRPSLLPHVAILRWPEEAAVVAYLRAEGQPRLLLVAPDVAAPPSSGWDEDWIRLPAREDDVRNRADALRARAVPNLRPEVSVDGRLSVGARWVALSPTEATMARTLCSCFGEVVTTEDLLVGDHDRVLTPTALRVHLTRLRKRLRPIGLGIRPVRGCGYVLDADDNPPSHPRRSRRPAREDTLLRVGDLALDLHTQQAWAGDDLMVLTPTEFAFLAVLARCPDEVVSSTQILGAVWGPGVNDTQYLRTYAGQLRRKLAAHTATARLTTAPGVGYRLAT